MQPKRIFTFYEGAGLFQHMEIRLINLWCDAWKKAGWQPHVYRLADTICHEKFSDLLKQALILPSTNDRFYHRMVFLRWLAFSHEDGVYADYDVFPMNPLPDLDLGTVTNCCETLQPGFIIGNRAWCNMLIELFLSYQPPPGSLMIADQEIMRAIPSLFPRTLDLLRLFGEPGWETFPLVHFSSDSTRHRIQTVPYLLKYDRQKTIRRHDATAPEATIPSPET